MGSPANRGVFIMKSITFILAILMVLTSIGADAATKKKSKKRLKQNSSAVSPYVIAIGYPNTAAAFTAIKARTDISPKENARPFGWQDRSGPWYVANEPSNLSKQGKFEWAFTQPGHYAHPSVIKRMIDIGSKDHVYVDMAFRCGAANKADCDKLLIEFQEVNLLIRKVYQKQYIVSAEGTPAWDGADSLD
jgi:hypothetical protein